MRTVGLLDVSAGEKGYVEIPVSPNRSNHNDSQSRVTSKSPSSRYDGETWLNQNDQANYDNNADNSWLEGDINTYLLGNDKDMLDVKVVS